MKKLKTIVLLGLSALLIFGCKNTTGGFVGGSEGSSGGQVGSPDSDFTPDSPNPDLDPTPGSGSVEGVETYINSEEALVDTIRAIVQEYIEAFSSSGYDRAATNSTDAAAQIQGFINAFMKQTESVIENFENGGEDLEIKFDKTIDIGEMKSAVWKDTVAEIVATMSDGEVSKDDIDSYIREMANEFGFSSEKDLYDFIDSVLSVNHISFAAKADINYDKDTQYDNTASLRLVTDIDVSDVNKIISKLANNQVDYDLPVKSISLYFQYGMTAEASNEDVTEFIEFLADGGEYPKLSDAKFNLSGKFSLRTAVCTADKVGGIIDVYVTAKEDKDIIMDLLKGSTDGMELEDVLNFMDKIWNIEISVSDLDGTKNTFRKDYKPSRVYELIMQAIQ